MMVQKLVKGVNDEGASGLLSGKLDIWLLFLLIQVSKDPIDATQPIAIWGTGWQGRAGNGCLSRVFGELFLRQTSHRLGAVKRVSSLLRSGEDDITQIVLLGPS